MFKNKRKINDDRLEIILKFLTNTTENKNKINYLEKIEKFQFLLFI